MKKIWMVLAVLIITKAAFAQIEAPVKWSYAAKRISSTEAVILMKATIQKGWHIYSLHVPDGGPIKTSFSFGPSKTYVVAGKPSEPKPASKFEKAFNMNVTYFENSVVFQQRIKLKTPAVTAIKGKLEYMTCNDLKCLPPEDLDFTVPLGK